MGIYEFVSFPFRVVGLLVSWLTVMVVGLSSLIGLSISGFLFDTMEVIMGIFRPSPKSMVMPRLRLAATIITNFWNEMFQERQNGQEVDVENQNPLIPPRF